MVAAVVAVVGVAVVAAAVVDVAEAVAGFEAGGKT